MKFNSTLLAVIASIITLIFWLVTDNTYDTGDSITHYAISHFSWKHPHLLFDNWGKPVFTILSSPFSQLGWKGMTFFNSMVGVGTCCIIGQIIEKLKWNISPYCALLIFFIPNYPLALNSGLTEPLYALILVAGLYFVITEHYVWSAVIISFLPYVRSEGFISAGVLIVVFLFAKKWKQLPFFLLGTVIISLIGYVFYMDSIMWLFETNPYIQFTGFNTYGSGNWGDYFIKFYYLTGLPFIILFWISSAIFLYIVLNKILKNFTTGMLSIEASLLFLFYSFFVAHVIFWKFGLFHSFGMSRVLISVFPIALLMVLYILNMLYTYVSNKIWVWAIATIIILFPFSVNKSSWSIPKDFAIDPEMAEMIEIKSSYKINPEEYSKIYFSSIPLMFFLDCDIYDRNKYEAIPGLIHKGIPTNEKILVIRDNWFLKMDCNVKSNNPIFKKLKKVYTKKVSDKNTIDIYTNNF